MASVTHDQRRGGSLLAVTALLVLPALTAGLLAAGRSADAGPAGDRPGNGFAVGAPADGAPVTVLAGYATDPLPEPDVSTEPVSTPAPTGTPTAPAEPTATGTPTPTEPPATEPAATVPATTAPSAQPDPTWLPPTRPRPEGPQLGVYVTTDDLALTPTYWNAVAGTTVDLRVTVTNTGQVEEAIGLSYQLPAGLTDAGTVGCLRTGSVHRCTAWAVAAGTSFSTRLRIRVSGDAWQRMPVSGLVRATATAPGHPQLTPVTDEQGFAVLFPAGPPTAGVSLSASEVAFDISGAPAGLELRLGNTGQVDSTGTVEIVLPAGVTVPAPPGGCRAGTVGRTRCELGTVRAGSAGVVRLTLAADAETQRRAPLAGAVNAVLTPVTGKAKRVQMSFRIVAAAASVPAQSSDGVAPTSSQGVLAGARPGAIDGPNSTRLTAVGLIVLSVLLVVLALGLATVSLRRRSEVTDPPALAPATSTAGTD
jgi:hypothetical protein